MNIFAFIPQMLGQFLKLIYDTLAFHNYGFAIIIFTIFVRLFLLPLNIKQYKSMSKIQELQPQVQEIQKRYKNDKEKLNQELTKLYSDNKANPAAGCLPLLIQLPIIFSLFYAVSRPLTYMLGKTQTQITELAQQYGVTVKNYQEIEIVKKAGGKILDMNFFGLNLGDFPIVPWGIKENAPYYLALLLLPLIAVVTTFLSTKFSMMQSRNNSSAATASMNNTMLYIGPIMTLIFSFQFPAGLSVYWIAGNVFTILQQWYMNKYIIKKKEVVGK